MEESMDTAEVGGGYKAGFSEEHIEELLIAGRAYRKDLGIDVLLTSDWGVGFDNLLAAKEQYSPMANQEDRRLRRPLSEFVGRLGRELSMRYHFAGGQNAACQLAPYRNSVHTTRFYGLGYHPPSLRPILSLLSMNSSFNACISILSDHAQIQQTLFNARPYHNQSTPAHRD